MKKKQIENLIEENTAKAVESYLLGVARVRNLFNYVEYVGEENNEPSMTVPDETMSMREILVRYAKGLPIDGGRNVYYDENDDLPDIKTLDLAERQQLAEQYKQEIESIKTRREKNVTLGSKVNEVNIDQSVTNAGNEVTE
jgi:hypothetical protein